MVRYTSEQRLFLYDTYVKYGYATKCRRRFQRKFRIVRLSSIQTIHTLVNKLKTMGLLIYKKQKHKRRVLTDKLDAIGATLEHTPRKSLKRLDLEIRVSKSSARTATQLLKLKSYKIALIQVLQPHDPASRVHFCS
jgi:hypothetical protein